MIQIMYNKVMSSPDQYEDSLRQIQLNYERYEGWKNARHRITILAEKISKGHTKRDSVLSILDEQVSATYSTGEIAIKIQDMIAAAHTLRKLQNQAYEIGDSLAAEVYRGNSAEIHRLQQTINSGTDMLIAQPRDSLYRALWIVTPDDVKDRICSLRKPVKKLLDSAPQLPTDTTQAGYILAIQQHEDMYPEMLELLETVRDVWKVETPSIPIARPTVEGRENYNEVRRIKIAIEEMILGFFHPESSLN